MPSISTVHCMHQFTIFSTSLLLKRHQTFETVAAGKISSTFAELFTHHAFIHELDTSLSGIRLKSYKNENSHRPANFSISMLCATIQQHCQVTPLALTCTHRLCASSGDLDVHVHVLCMCCCIHICSLLCCRHCHHCVWLNLCVGTGNHVLFLLFVTVHSLQAMLWLALSLYAWSVEVRRISRTAHNTMHYT